MTGSLAVVSEAAHSATDLFASLIAFFSVRVADLPADEEHPYGHGKAESLSGMAEALLILFAAVTIIYQSITKLLAGSGPERVDLGMAAMVTSIAVNSTVAARLFRVAEETDSPALRADGNHLRADVYTSGGVLVGLALVGLTKRPAWDSAIALLVAALLVRAAWQLARSAVAPLMDSQLPAQDMETLRAVLASDPRIRGYHKLRTRKSGSYRYVDAHLLLDDDLSLLDAHELTEAVEDRIRGRLPNTEITLHTEPFRAERRHQHERHGGPRPEDE